MKFSNKVDFEGSNKESPTGSGGSIVLVVILVVLLAPCAAVRFGNKKTREVIYDDGTKMLFQATENTNCEALELNGKKDDSHRNPGDSGVTTDTGKHEREEILPKSRLAHESRKEQQNWRCACEGGFLPPGLLKSFAGAEAVMRMSSGQCYHKQT
jgi:hypothetical protein